MVDEHIPDPRQEMVDAMRLVQAKLRAEADADDAGEVSDDQWLDQHPDLRPSNGDVHAAREKHRQERAQALHELQVRIGQLGPDPLHDLFTPQPQANDADPVPDTGHYDDGHSFGWPQPTSDAPPSPGDQPKDSRSTPPELPRQETPPQPNAPQPTQPSPPNPPTPPVVTGPPGTPGTPIPGAPGWVWGLDGKPTQLETIPGLDGKPMTGPDGKPIQVLPTPPGGQPLTPATPTPFERFWDTIKRAWKSIFGLLVLLVAGAVAVVALSSSGGGSDTHSPVTESSRGTTALTKQRAASEYLAAATPVNTAVSAFLPAEQQWTDSTQAADAQRDAQGLLDALQHAEQALGSLIGDYPDGAAALQAERAAIVNVVADLQSLGGLGKTVDLSPWRQQFSEHIAALSAASDAARAQLGLPPTNS